MLKSVYFVCRYVLDGWMAEKKNEFEIKQKFYKRKKLFLWKLPLYSIIVTRNLKLHHVFAPMILWK